MLLPSLLLFVAAVVDVGDGDFGGDGRLMVLLLLLCSPTLKLYHSNMNRHDTVVHLTLAVVTHFASRDKDQQANKPQH